MTFSLSNIVIKPDLVTLFTEIAPCVLPCPKTQEHQSPCESIGYPKMDIIHWDAAIYYGVQLAKYCDQTRSCNAILGRSPPKILTCPRTQEHQSTSVDSCVHRVPEKGISHWDAAIHYGVQLAQYCDQTRSSNVILGRSPPVLSLALELRNTKVLVWTHESIEYPKMDISHWDAVIHYGVHLAQYCDQTRSCNAILGRSPPVFSLALGLRNTNVPMWTHESIGFPKMDISDWDAAIHYGVQLAQYCDQTRSCNATLRRTPPVYSLALRLRNTKVPVWTHESIGYPKMDISHWDAAIHYDVQLAQYCDQTRSCNATLGRSPTVHILALTLSIAAILSGNTLTTSVMVKTFNDICVSFISTSNIGLLVVYLITILW